MAQEIADSTLLDTWASGGNIVEPDVSKIIEGWQLGEQPPHEYMNWLQNTFGSKLNHILKNGVASWNNETEYLAGSSVQYGGNIWLCKTTNINSAPTDANANWKRIITIEALENLLVGYVATTGNQTIAGVKTFSYSPIVPTPTTGTQAVNKDYVDNAATLNINALDEKTTPADTDNLALQEAGGLLKKLSFANLKESLKNTFLTKHELVAITGIATFDGTTQNINMTEVGNITLAIGDVIEVSGTTSNNKLFTVESITDNNNIVVNYEHRGTSGLVPIKRLINETASNCTIKLYNRAKNAPLGQGQGWCSPASGRAKDIEYPNNTKREIATVISWVSPNSSAFTIFRVDGFAPQYASAGSTAGTYTFAIGETTVSAGSKYSLQLPSGTIQYWLELR